jgi:SAM-dependent methyltransferase
MTDAVDYRHINALKDGIDWVDPFTVERYLQFARHMRRDATDVLDVGCHTGDGGRILKAKSPKLRIAGLDVCPEFVDRLPTDIYVAGISSSAASIGVKNASFDMVVAGEFIEHLAEADVESALGEFHRVLRDGGRLLLTTPNPSYYRLVLSGKSVIGGSHLSQHEPGRLCKRLARHGFEGLRVLGSGRVSRLLGERFPLLAAYGSYLVVADKASGRHVDTRRQSDQKLTSS